jgi:NAD(P)-dependent dehydrogenase (short-subunit alcohol dehydrogenase family)
MYKYLSAVLLTCLALTVLPTQAATEPTPTTRKAILITGASTGIGRLTAETLAAKGHLVYAGARKNTDIAELNAIENIQAVQLDVTVQEQVDQALEFVKANGHGLWGLVNNAGINKIDPLIELDMEDLQWLFEVNVFGVARVTKAFAPLIIESSGRIVNISSISGILSGLPAYGGYSMTKHAIEAYTDQLAAEMARFDVKIVGIEPGNFSSEIGMTRCKGIVAKNKHYKYYQDVMQEHIDFCRQRIKTNAPSGAAPAIPVASAVESALFDATPSEHYLVTSAPFEAQIVMNKMFEEILNYNHAATHSYDREQLIQIMDSEWEILKGLKQRPMFE